MLIAVIPLEKSIGREPLLYRVFDPWKSQIQKGSLIEIPYGNSLIEGVIYDILPEDTSIDTSSLKSISRVLSETPLLDGIVLSVIISLSQRYFLPIHKSALLFLPKSLRTWLGKKNYITHEKTSYTTEGSREGVILHSVHENIKSGALGPYLSPGTVFVFPESLTLRRIAQSLEGGDHPIGIISSLGTETQKKKEWLEVTTGKFPIIFGTRKILYYNLECYHTIVYIDDAFGTEQFSYPIRIRSIDLLSFYRDHSKKNIMIMTSSPLLSTLADFSSFPVRSITL